MRVLVTEDDARMASLLGQALLEADHEVRVVGSGERAIDAVDEDVYDLVLLDVMLPRLDGFATCRRMRERGGTMGILMLTARDDVEDRVRGLDAGADDYLGKPFSLEELLARVRAFERRGPAGVGPRIAVGELVLDTGALGLWGRAGGRGGGGGGGVCGVAGCGGGWGWVGGWGGGGGGCAGGGPASSPM